MWKKQNEESLSSQNDNAGMLCRASCKTPRLWLCNRAKWERRMNSSLLLTDSIGARCDRGRKKKLQRKQKSQILRIISCNMNARGCERFWMEKWATLHWKRAETGLTCRLAEMNDGASERKRTKSALANMPTQSWSEWSRSSLLGGWVSELWLCCIWNWNSK